MEQEVLLFDLECNSLTPTVIHCIGILNLETLEYQDYYGDTLADGILRLSKAQVLCGHNIRTFDCYWLRVLTQGLVKFENCEIIDTLELSRQLFKGLPNHKLKTWGDLLGYPKLDFTDYENFSEDMLMYMERDVMLNYKVFKILVSLL